MQAIVMRSAVSTFLSLSESSNVMRDTVQCFSGIYMFPEGDFGNILKGPYAMDHCTGKWQCFSGIDRSSFRGSL